MKFCDVCRRLWGFVADEQAPFYEPPVVVCPSCWARVTPRRLQ